MSRKLEDRIYLEVLKGFGDDNVVIYMDKSEDALRKSIELIENGCIGEMGMKAKKILKGLAGTVLRMNLRGFWK